VKSRKRRFFILQEDLLGGSFVIRGREFHHLKHVMRLKVGDSVEALDGSGWAYTGKITCLLDDHAQCSLEDKQEYVWAKDVRLHLLQSVIKEKNMALMFQKATELGVSSITPFLSARSVVKLSKQDQIQKHARWSKIIQDAAKQSGNLTPPHLHACCRIEDIKKLTENQSFAHVLLMTPSGGEPLEPMQGDILVAIGPEGGLTPLEEEEFLSLGARPISCGPLVMRSETAAIYIASIIHHLNKTF